MGWDGMGQRLSVVLECSDDQEQVDDTQEKDGCDDNSWNPYYTEREWSPWVVVAWITLPTCTPGEREDGEQKHAHRPRHPYSGHGEQNPCIPPNGSVRLTRLLHIRFCEQQSAVYIVG